MHPHKEIFDKLFAKRITLTEIANRCGVSVPVAHRWVNDWTLRGEPKKCFGIPKHHWPAIVDFAQENDIDLTMDHFKKIEMEKIEKMFNDFE